MGTIADVIDEARYYIQDTREPLRQDDDELLTYFRNGLAILYRYRPDVFVASSGGPCEGVPELCRLSDPLPVSSEYSPALAYYVAASAELKDDEHVSSGRASYMFNLAYTTMGVSKLTE